MTATVLSVMPSGADDAPCSLADPGSIVAAQHLVRRLAPTMAEDIVVELAGGTYRLSDTWRFDASDSGRHGHEVVYRARRGETVVISGGTEVAGWENVGGNVFRTRVDPELRGARQLYVAGVRARRARGLASIAATWSKWGDHTSGGFFAGSAGPEDTWNFDHPELLELVGFTQWKTMRCPVGSIERGRITVQQPAWSNSQFQTPSPVMNSVAWVENAYELMDEPGEWYLHRPTGELYYLARDEEISRDALNVAVVLPRLERLIEASGDIDGPTDRPVEAVAFEGLTFAESTWTRPNEPGGYTPAQASSMFVDSEVIEPERRDIQAPWKLMPAALRFAGTRQIRIERCRFTRLGADALQFVDGHADNPGTSITASVFDDISGGAIVIGSLEPVLAGGVEQRDERLAMRNFLVRDNTIRNVAVEYHNCAGIFVTFAEAVSIIGNEIENLPWCGISVGWGWGSPDATEAGRNLIMGNRVRDVVGLLADGGGIYTLGRQPESVIAENYVSGVGNDHAQELPVWGGIYLDAATEGYEVRENVVERIICTDHPYQRWSTPGFWLLAQHGLGSGDAVGNRIARNYAETTNVYCYPVDEDRLDEAKNDYSRPQVRPWEKRAAEVVSAAGRGYGGAAIVDR